MSPRLADDLFVQWVDDEAVVLNQASGHLHYLNPSAAFVYALIEEFGFEKGIEELKQHVPEDAQLEDELPQLLDQMIEEGLLVPDS